MMMNIECLNIFMSELDFMEELVIVVTKVIGWCNSESYKKMLKLELAA